MWHQYRLKLGQAGTKMEDRLESLGAVGMGSILGGSSKNENE